MQKLCKNMQGEHGRQSAKRKEVTIKIMHKRKDNVKDGGINKREKNRQTD